MGLKGIVRSEYIVVNEVPHLLEINSVPGMTEKSIIPQQLKALGMGLSHLVIGKKLKILLKLVYILPKDLEVSDLLEV